MCEAPSQNGSLLIEQRQMKNRVHNERNGVYPVCTWSPLPGDVIQRIFAFRQGKLNFGTFLASAPEVCSRASRRVGGCPRLHPPASAPLMPSMARTGTHKPTTHRRRWASQHTSIRIAGSSEHWKPPSSPPVHPFSRRAENGRVGGGHDAMARARH